MSDWQFRQSGPERKEFDINWNIVQSNWKQFKGKVRAQWGKRSSDRSDEFANKNDEVADKIQETYGDAKDKVVERDKIEEQIRRIEK